MRVGQAVFIHTKFRLNHGWAKMTSPFLSMWTFSLSQADKNLRTMWSSNLFLRLYPKIESTLWNRHLYSNVLFRKNDLILYISILWYSLHQKYWITKKLSVPQKVLNVFQFHAISVRTSIHFYFSRIREGQICVRVDWF